MGATNRASLRELGLILPDWSKLPVRCWLGRRSSVDTLVESVHEGNKTAVSALIKATASRAEGLSMDQFQTQKDIDDFLAVGFSVCLIDRSDGGKLYGFLKAYPSPLCRSNAPVMGAGYAILEAAYRDKGVYADMLEILTLLGTSEGYYGTLSRTVVLPSPAYRGIKRHGKFLSGTIADSYQADGIWADELVTFEDLRHWYTFQDRSALTPKSWISNATIPSLNVERAKFLCQPSIAGKFANITELFPTAGKTPFAMQHIYLQLAGSGAIEVEEMIRAAAQRGEGFALDEFDQDGFLNRRFLRQSVTLVARRRLDHVLIGGAVLGPSALARATEPCNLGGYIVVSEKHRRRGYGSEILALCEHIAKRMGYRNITTDLLSSSGTSGALQLAFKREYVVTGQLTSCAFLKDFGPANSLLLFKNIQGGQLTSRL